MASTGTPAPPSTPAPTPALAPPKAFVMVDAATGRVLAADDDRTPMLVASTAKLFTALVARERVPLDAPVIISPLAAGEPALNINAKAGQVWKASDLFECLLLVSANDAAMALAEASGPHLPNFEQRVADLTRTLRLADHPVLRDPAGLDGHFSIAGGNLVSARDLAIAARAVLADPVLANIARQKEYRFKGGDGIDHVIRSHNHFMLTYPGAIGLKTGWTERAGHALVAAATRNGRTLIVVVVGASDPVRDATNLMNLGWLTRSSPGDDQLPPVPARDASGALVPTPSSVPIVRSPHQVAAPKAARASTGPATDQLERGWLALIAGSVVLATGLGVLVVRRRLLAAGPLADRPGRSRRQRARQRRRQRRSRG